MEDPKNLRVLQAAKAVFLRYGFRRVTMQDIASEAGISRPALYLIHPNKEEIFKAVARQIAEESLAAIRAGLPHHGTVEAQLRFAFEVWFVHTFQLMLASPDARDVIECAQGFARDTVLAISAAFETVVVDILRPLTKGRRAVLPAAEIAHLLAASAHGFKESVTTVEQLRSMIAGLLTLTLAALEDAPAGKKHKRR